MLYILPLTYKMLCLGEMVRNIVCEGVKKAGFFSLLADETKDCSKREQMSRYVDDAAVIITCGGRRSYC